MEKTCISTSLGLFFGKVFLFFQVAIISSKVFFKKRMLKMSNVNSEHNEQRIK